MSTAEAMEAVGAAAAPGSAPAGAADPPECALAALAGVARGGSGEQCNPGQPHQRPLTQQSTLHADQQQRSQQQEHLEPGQQWQQHQHDEASEGGQEPGGAACGDSGGAHAGGHASADAPVDVTANENSAPAGGINVTSGAQPGADVPAADAHVPSASPADDGTAAVRTSSWGASAAPAPKRIRSADSQGSPAVGPHERASPASTARVGGDGKAAAASARAEGHTNAVSEDTGTVGPPGGASAGGGALSAHARALKAPFDGHSMLVDTAADGVVRVAWTEMHAALEERLCRVLDLYHARASSSANLCEGPQLPVLPDGERFEEMRDRMVGALRAFQQGPPFSIQRLCEIMLVPTLHYSTLSKLVLALEKCLLVTTMIKVDVGAPRPPPTLATRAGAGAARPAPAPSQLCQADSPAREDGNASDTDGSDGARSDAATVPSILDASAEVR